MRDLTGPLPAHNVSFANANIHRIKYKVLHKHGMYNPTGTATTTRSRGFYICDLAGLCTVRGRQGNQGRAGGIVSVYYFDIVTLAITGNRNGYYRRCAGV